MIVSVVRFRSRLADEDVQATFEQRGRRYQTVPGLIEKIDLRFRDTGEHGAIYIWDSDDAFERFCETDLAGAMHDAYEVVGTPRMEVADVRMVVASRAPAPSSV